jgi:hypothetical protein
MLSLRTAIKVLTFSTVVAVSVDVRADTIRFTNNEVDLGTNSQIDLSDQYARFGLVFERVYRYIDGRDPFSDAPNQLKGGANLGIANGNVADISLPVLGRITVLSRVSRFSFDWWNVNGGALEFEAFDSSRRLVDSFLPDANTPFGTHRIDGPVRFVTFASSEGGGFAGIANVTVVPTAPTPEPASLFLIVTAFIIALLHNWRDCLNVIGNRRLFNVAIDARG